MLTRTSQYKRQSISPTTKEGHLTLVTDLSREPVFLKGRVKNSTAFAAAMLTLGKIVKTSARQGPKDYSAYQEWVQGEYLKDMGDIRAKRLERLPSLRKRDAQLRKLIRELEKDIREASENLNSKSAIRKFWNWLYDHNREAWIVIDPIVSIQEDAFFFEGFSLDESVYARVTLPASSVETNEPIQPGTTNIDFGLGLDKEFSRIRSYRPLDLTVGAGSVEIETDLGSAVEKKIDLPESWVRGLVEVQSALAVAPITLEVTPVFIAEIISRLEAEREKHGPRSLRFKLEPGKAVSVELEPWGDIIVDPESHYGGSDKQEIRIWGRRRLILLKDLLPDASSVKVHLMASGMPSFWAVTVDNVELQIGLSGWTNLDWASRARFSAFMPTVNISDQELTRSAALLKSNGLMSPAEMATQSGSTLQKALAALQKLCSVGKAMYDCDRGVYRWRELFPEFDLEKINEAGLEERMGIEFFRSDAVNVKSESNENGRRQVSATVDDNGLKNTEVEFDSDGRVVYSKCCCSHFRYHRLRQGPCRHMVAVSLSEAEV